MLSKLFLASTLLISVTARGRRITEEEIAFRRRLDREDEETYRRLTCQYVNDRFTSNANEKLSNAEGINSAGADNYFGGKENVIWLYVETQNTVPNDQNHFGCKPAVHEYFHLLQQGFLSKQIVTTVPPTDALGTSRFQVLNPDPSMIPDVFAMKVKSCMDALPNSVKLLSEPTKFVLIPHSGDDNSMHLSSSIVESTINKLKESMFEVSKGSMERTWWRDLLTVHSCAHVPLFSAFVFMYVGMNVCMYVWVWVCLCAFAGCPGVHLGLSINRNENNLIAEGEAEIYALGPKPMGYLATYIEPGVYSTIIFPTMNFPCT